MRSHRFVGAGVVAAVLVVGCTAPAPNQPSIEPTSTAPIGTAPTSAAPTQSASPTSGAPCPAAAPSTLKVSKGTLPKGKSFGFVHHFDGTALYVDPAEFLGGNAAVTAAREDGEIGPHEDLPNPFYIRNHSKAIVRVPVGAKLRVSLLDVSDGGSPVQRDRTAAELAALYCGGDRPDWAYAAGPEMPANLTVVNGEVARVEERYTP